MTGKTDVKLMSKGCENAIAAEMVIVSTNRESFPINLGVNPRLKIAFLPSIAGKPSVSNLGPALLANSIYDGYVSAGSTIYRNV